MTEPNLSLLKGGARGRRDGGQEQVIKVKVVKERIEELVDLHKAAETAKEDLSSAIKATAQEAGLEASVVKRFVAARSGENFTKSRRKSEQLELLFDQVGE
jgi:hypothetical protein